MSIRVNGVNTGPSPAPAAGRMQHGRDDSVPARLLLIWHGHGRHAGAVALLTQSEVKAADLRPQVQRELQGRQLGCLGGRARLPDLHIV